MTIGTDENEFTLVQRGIICTSDIYDSQRDTASDRGVDEGRCVLVAVKAQEHKAIAKQIKRG